MTPADDLPVDDPTNGANGADHESGADEAATPQPAETPVRPTSNRAGLVKEKRGALTPWVAAQGDELGRARVVVLRGDGIGRTSAELDKVAAALGRLATFLRAMGATPRIGGQAVYFAQSVHVELLPSSDEIKRSQDALREAAEVTAAAAPTAETRELALSLRTQAVLDLDVALSLAADLMAAPVDEAPLRSAQLGTDVTTAYLSFAGIIAKEGLSVEIPTIEVVDDATTETTVSLAYGRAERVVKAIKESIEPTSSIVEVPGHLSLADAEKRSFGLRLEPGASRPPELKGKSVVRGTYTLAAEDAITANGLWNTRVMAQIDVRRDAVISTSTIRRPSYELLNVWPDERDLTTE